MSAQEQKQKYRSVLLDKATSSDARRSETVEVTIAGETLEVEVRAQPLNAIDNIEPLDAVVEEAGEELATQIAYVCACAYIPGTDEQIFSAEQDQLQLTRAQFDANGFLNRLYQAVNFVHGFRKLAPDGIEDPRLKEIEQSMSELEEICRGADGGTVDATKVRKVATHVRNYVSYINNGETDDGDSKNS